jgi:predicted metallopeptidase
MPIKYFPAEDIKVEALEISKTLGWNHIDFSNLGFLRSRGSTSRGTIARCHALGKAMQLAMGRTTGFYLIEVIAEKFDKMSAEDKTKVIIHELMHIPSTFGGGFKHHHIVNDKSVEIAFREYKKRKGERVWF